MINRAAKHIHLPQAAAVGVVHTLYAFFFVCFSLSASVYAQTTFTPGAAPLIARSTYLNAYSIYGNASRFPVSWPVYNADPQQIVGWSGLVRIDDAAAAVSWLGDIIVPNVTAANVSAISLTPTKTVVTMTAGPMSLNITFLSPIEPGDFVRQSIPFSYMTFECSSTDGNAHHVQIFTDISGEWLSGDRSQIMTWSTTVDGSSSRIYHTAQLQNPLQFSENAGQAQWGTLYHATSGGNGVTYRTGWADDNRNQFVAKGTLDNSQDTNFRAISNNFPTLAFSNDLGSIKSTTKPVVFAVGFNRRPAVQYTDLTGTTLSRQLFYRANYTDADTLVNFVLGDYPAAAKRANQLDNTLSSAATSAGGADLANLVSLTARQVFGSTEMTIGTGSNGKLNTSDAMMFMRGTNGASAGRVQPVEDLFAAWPLFMVVDPTLGGPLLEPLFRFQSAREYTVQFATQDLGTSYPNATGANNAHNQGIEQSANMIIMAYAHALFSGDGSVIAQYYPLLKTWANYLISHTLTPTDQVSADGLAVANQTNLAVKGIIAINAMSKISTALNNTADMQIFQNNASSLYTQWKSMALGSGNRMLLAYGNSNSWTLGYNLFADKWLGLNMVDSVIYSGQTTQFQSFISANAASTNFGLPTDSHDTNTIAPSWNLLAAAYAPDSSVQSTLVNHILSRAALSSTNDGLPNQYNATTGARTAGFSSPALGATFGQIALKLTQQSITVPPSTGGGDGGGSGIIGPVVGGVVGGIAALCGVAGLLWFLRRRKQQRSRRTDIILDEHIPEEREAPYKDHTTVPAPYMYSDTAASTSNGRSQSAESVDSSTPALRPDGWGEEAYSDLPESHSDSNGTRTTGPLGLRNPWPRGQEQELRAMNVDPDYVESASSQAPNPPLSSKLIAEMRRTRDASPAIGTAAISTSPRPAGSSVASPSQSEDQAAAALREEVANLRREMEEIRMERVEAPPRYDDA